MKFNRILIITACTMLIAIAAFAAEITVTANLMTLEDIAKYNGKNGQAAYLAVENKVYDITNLDAWKNGTNKELKAGRVISKGIIAKDTLNGCPIVGKVIKVFTLEEVSKYDGKNGKPLYSVVNDMVYDQTPGKKSNGKIIGKIITPAN